MSLFATLSKLPLLGDFFKREFVPVIRFSGIISDNQKRAGISFERYRKIIDKAFSINGVKTVALVINCPGGTPAQAELIASYIRRLADDKDIEVIAFIEDVAASGGYWLACAADTIYGAQTSICGSIGVISASFGFDEFIKKYGVSRRVYTQGKEKSMLDPFLPEKQTDVKRLKTIQKELHTHFIDWVQSRRGDKLNGTTSSLFEGQIWLSDSAIEKGVIDHIGECQSVLEDKYGQALSRIELQPEKKLFSLPFLTVQSSSLSDDLSETLESRWVWQRFGI